MNDETQRSRMMQRSRSRSPQQATPSLEAVGERFRRSTLSTMPGRRGFTLIEMLVATGVFLIGFTAAYSLFLVAMRNRALSDATLRGTLAATSQIATMRLYATHEYAGGTEYTPEFFIGNGNPLDGGETGSNADVKFYSYPDDPSVYYRVIQSTDLSGSEINKAASGFRVLILVGTVGNIGADVTLENLLKRFRLDESGTNDERFDRLLSLDSFQRFDAILHRRAVW